MSKVWKKIFNRSLTLAALCSLWVVVGWAGSSQEPASSDPIRVDVNLTTLRFTVRDSLGRYNNGLDETDFRVLEDGIPQEIAFFERPRNSAGAAKRTWVAFLLDVSGSTFATRAEEIVAAQTFLANITDATQTGIYGFTDKLLVLQDFTPNKEVALQAFRQARRHLGKTAIYDSLNTLLSELTRRAGPAEQKAVILISDGLDENFVKSSAAIARARQMAVTVYTILVPSAAQIYIGPALQDGTGANRRDPLREEKEAAFARLSSQTGGQHFSGFETILDFDDTLAKINDHLFGNLYTIGYSSDRSPESVAPRNVDVRLNRSGLVLSEPFKRVPRELAPKRSFIAALFDNKALEELDGGSQSFREIGAEMDLLTPILDGGDRGIPFRIKINPYTFQDPERRGVSTQLGIVGVLIDSEGREAVRLREIFHVNMGAKEIREGRGIVYTNKLLAPSGSYRLKLALLELATWRLTSFESQIRIP